MQLPEWNNKYQRWDMYKAFHMNVGDFDPLGSGNCFTIFDTGEVICHLRSPRPDIRRLFTALNVRVVMTGDREMPALRTPDGISLKKAWLHDAASQYLLIDYDTGQVVRLHSGLKLDEPVPPRLQKHFPTAYFAGAGCRPVGGPITVAMPHKFLTEEEQEHLKTLHAVCRAALSLRGDMSGISYSRDQLHFLRAMVVKDFSELGDEDQRRLYYNGIARRRVEFPYLELDR